MALKTKWIYAGLLCFGVITTGGHVTSAHEHPIASIAKGAFIRDTTTPFSIGTDRQLFVDDYLINRLASGAHLQLHHPVPRELVLHFNKPWEGNACDFVSIFKDDHLYRMYYGAVHFTIKKGKVTDDSHPYFICYAESKDGIHWLRPDLGIISFNGSKANNIIMQPKDVGEKVSILPEASAMFKDGNPLASPEARYKAMIRNYSFKRKVTNGMLAMKSADGINWKLMQDSPVITDGDFDSQNVAFWDEKHQEYRAYWRYKVNYVREIRTARSKDFLHWTDIEDLKYANSPQEELYTNVVKPYYRAPQMYIGLPVRYVQRNWGPSMDALPDSANRRLRSTAESRFGTALTETLIMGSRDGVHFKRWNEAFMRPGIERKATWNYGQQYAAWSMVETKSGMEGAPNELSFYNTEGTWGTLTPDGDGLRRYTLRLDGFVSVNTPMSGGELFTQPIVFDGTELLLNFSTSAAGEIKVEILDIDGKVIRDYSADDCASIFGDSINRKVYWNKGGDVSSLAGRVVRLHFVMKDADLYSFKFM